MQCLVTGASGFIGQALVQYLLDRGAAVRAATASPEAMTPPGARPKPGLEIHAVPREALAVADWQAACRNIDVIFHLAGQARRHAGNAPDLYERANLLPTRALAEAASAAHVRRFILASSITVYGLASPPGQAFREDSPPCPAPQDAYARSKLAAENVLRAPAMSARLPSVIVRLPPVYGHGVKGNMATLTRLVAYASRWHIPLPLAGIDNRRSFINLPNLLDFLWRVATRAQADGQILLCSDREDVSCATLLTAMGEAQGAPIHLFAAPRLLETACRLLGQDARHASLTGNFQIDPSRSCDRLAWQPRTSLAKGLREMVTSSPT